MKVFFDKYGASTTRFVALCGAIFVVASTVVVIQDMSDNTILEALQNLDEIIKIVGLLVILLLGFGWYLDHQSLQRTLHRATDETRDKEEHLWRHRTMQYLSVELVGTVISVIAICIVVLFFQEYRDIENDKIDLMRQMASPDNDFALEAVRLARLKSWLQDGSFAGISLASANLQDAHLGESDLSGTSFVYANLQGVSLWSANLRSANLTFANLSEVNAKHVILTDANLDNADLSRADLLSGNFKNATLRNATIIQTILAAADFTAADLSNASLVSSNLDGSNLTGANLLSADMTNVFLNNTILPDQTIGNPNTDLARYTNKSHPDYEATLMDINRIRTERGFSPIQP